MIRRYLRVLPLLPVLILALLAVWSTGHDLARHEQYAATAAVWFFWVAVTALVVGS